MIFISTLGANLSMNSAESDNMACALTEEEERCNRHTELELHPDDLLTQQKAASVM